MRAKAPASSPAAGDRQAVHAALSVASRLDLLDRLRRSTDALDVDELARRTGLHRNTVRFHLDVLANAGLVTSRSAPSGGRGRPRHVYEATETSEIGQGDGYRLLAQTLTSYLATSSKSGLDSGRQAGRLLARSISNPFGHARTSGLATARHVDTLFSDLGFGSTLHRRAGGYQLSLHACPFRDLAAEHPDVVCGMHAGLLEETVGQINSPIEHTALMPFVEPRLCVAQLTTSPSRSGTP